MSDEDERRRARESWEVRKFGPESAEEAADHDALFWARIPPEQRAAAVWNLSLEMYALADPEAAEATVPRSALRLQRR